MKTSEKLELFRRVNCLNEKTVSEIFDGDDHLIRKYRQYKERDEKKGNFDFLFSLDLSNAKKFFGGIE